MKDRMIVPGMILALLMLGGAALGEGTAPPKKGIKTFLADLKKAVKSYKKNAVERDKARRQAEKDMQTLNGQKTTADDVATYQARMDNDLAEARDDMAFLDAHSGEMTQKQKAAESKARESLE